MDILNHIQALNILLYAQIMLNIELNPLKMLFIAVNFS